MIAPTRETLRGGRLAAYLGLGAACGLALGALPAAVPTALAVLGVLLAPILVWLLVRAPRDEARVLLPIVLGAVAVRVVVAVVIAYAAPDGYFSVDQGRYELLGRELADYWAGLAPYPETIHSKRGYYVWNALVYSAVGFVPLAVTLTNAAIAALTVILSYRIAAALHGPVAARTAALFAAFFPSLVLWSSLNLKDAAAILSILVALRGAQRCLSGAPLAGLVGLFVGFVVLDQLRDYLVLILATAIGLALLMPRLRSLHVPLVAGAAAALVLFAGTIPVPVEEITADANLEALAQHRQNLAVGNSAYHGNADISTPRAAIGFLPLGLAYFLFAPAPWQLWTSRQWLTLPEMLVWYALIPQVFFGARAMWRGRVASALPFVAFGLLATVAYALVESNLGTAYRHRAQVLILYLLFAAIGLASRSERVAARQPSAALGLPA